MKAVLVIDRFPESCCDCDFITNEDGTIVFKCSLIGMNVPTFNERLNNCPLKELPEHKPDDPLEEGKIAEKEHVPIDWFQAYCTGWNACLKKIKGTED